MVSGAATALRGDEDSRETFRVLRLFSPLRGNDAVLAALPPPTLFCGVRGSIPPSLSSSVRASFFVLLPLAAALLPREGDGLCFTGDAGLFNGPMELDRLLLSFLTGPNEVARSLRELLSFFIGPGLAVLRFKAWGLAERPVLCRCLEDSPRVDSRSEPDDGVEFESFFAGFVSSDIAPDDGLLLCFGESKIRFISSSKLIGSGIGLRHPMACGLADRPLLSRCVEDSRRVESLFFIAFVASSKPALALFLVGEYPVSSFWFFSLFFFPVCSLIDKSPRLFVDNVVSLTSFDRM